VVNYSLVAWELFTVFVPSFESKLRRFLHEPIPESSSIKLLRPTIDSIFFMLKIPEKFHFLLLKPPRNLSRNHFHAVSTAPGISGGLESLGGGVDGTVSTHRTWESVGISVLYSQHELKGLQCRVFSRILRNPNFLPGKLFLLKSCSSVGVSHSHPMNIP